MRMNRRNSSSPCCRIRGPCTAGFTHCTGCLTATETDVCPPEITAADANLLTGYGINVYQTWRMHWVKTLRISANKVKKASGSEIHSDGIQNAVRTVKRCKASAMNSWDGMFAQMEANLLNFA